MSYVEPSMKKANYTELYANEVEFQQLRKQYQQLMSECKPGTLCTQAVHLNVELQNKLGTIDSLLNQLKPKNSSKKRQEVIRNLDKLSQDYDTLMREMDEHKTAELKNLDTSITAVMYNENSLPWLFGTGAVILLSIWTAL
jgi:hypothetical protein